MMHHLRLICFCSVVLGSSDAWAHRIGEGYLIISIHDRHIDGRVELHFEDIQKALGLDRDNDGSISEAELDHGIDQLVEYVRPRVSLAAGSSDRELHFSGHSVKAFTYGKFAQLDFRIDDIDSVPDSIEIDYRLLFDHDPNQRGLLVIERNAKTGFVNDGESVSAVFTPDANVQEIDLTQDPARNVFVLFVKEGIWHIWIGIDHILFLVALLLPSVRDRSREWWYAVSDFKPALWSVVKIVTLFTVAHSITLALAALRIVELPGWIVESVIAGSIIVAAADNIVPIFRGRIGWVIFGFGLFHGLGFASVLSHLTLAQTSLLTTLFGFNIGVELGQIAIICVVFPLLFALRQAATYPRLVQQGGSFALILIGFCWVLERTLDVTILGI